MGESSVNRSPSPEPIELGAMGGPGPAKAGRKQVDLRSESACISTTARNALLFLAVAGVEVVLALYVGHVLSTNLPPELLITAMVIDAVVLVRLALLAPKAQQLLVRAIACLKTIEIWQRQPARFFGSGEGPAMLGAGPPKMSGEGPLTTRWDQPIENADQIKAKGTTSVKPKLEVELPKPVDKYAQLNELEAALASKDPTAIEESMEETVQWLGELNGEASWMIADSTGRLNRAQNKDLQPLDKVKKSLRPIYQAYKNLIPLLTARDRLNKLTDTLTPHVNAVFESFAKKVIDTQYNIKSSPSFEELQQASAEMESLYNKIELWAALPHPVAVGVIEVDRIKALAFKVRCEVLFQRVAKAKSEGNKEQLEAAFKEVEELRKELPDAETLAERCNTWHAAKEMIIEQWKAGTMPPEKANAFCEMINAIYPRLTASVENADEQAAVVEEILGPVFKMMEEPGQSAPAPQPTPPVFKPPNEELAELQTRLSELRNTHYITAQTYLTLLEKTEHGRGGTKMRTAFAKASTAFEAVNSTVKLLEARVSELSAQTGRAVA